MFEKLQNDSKQGEALPRLRPRGKGHHPCNDEVKLTDAAKISLIEDCKRRFYQSCGYDMRRTTERERPFICKPKFVLDRVDSSFSQDVLLSLLADRTTLFSLNYQVHEFYRNIRNERGMTRQEQRQSCMEEALRHCSEREPIYRPVLAALEEYARNSNCSVCKLQDMLVQSATKSCEYAPTKLLQFLKKIYDESPPQQLEEISAQVKDYWELADNSPEIQKEICLKFFCRMPLNGRFVQEQLRKWLDNLQLTEQEAGLFVCDCLSYYCEQEQLLKAAENEAGHYSPSFRIVDAKRYRQYKCDYEQLKSLLSEVQSRKTCVEKFPFLKRTSFSVGPYLLADQSPRTLDDIVRVTDGYLDDTRCGAQGLQEEYVASLIRQVWDSCGQDKGCFPFCYMVVCVVGSRNMFSRPYSVSEEQIQNFQKHIYRAKPFKWKQRVARIRLLHELCNISGVSPAERRNNWELFLRYHGGIICSVEEEHLWREIIGLPIDDIVQPVKIYIPLIEFQLRCQRHLRECFPICPETQYCYTVNSPLHLGGYAKFLRDHPEALKACTKRMIQAPKMWEQELHRYLKEWSTLNCDIDYIKELCGGALRRWKWESIPDCSRTALKAFFKETSPGSYARLEDYVKELKALMVESAMRSVLCQRASVALGEQVERILTKVHG